MTIQPTNIDTPATIKEYTPPALLFNGHLETIYPSLFRKVSAAPYERERIYTPDDDFLDLDWMRQGSDKVVIISHGLEGNSQRAYIKGMARAFFGRNYDVLAWNYRGCSEEMNRQVRFYHSGATDDLDLVVRHAATRYNEVYLIGFSLGGNLTLKYLGEQGTSVHANVKKGAAFSVPMDLYHSCLQISKPENYLYSKRFLKSMKKKLRLKAANQKSIDLTGMDDIQNLEEFDNRYTAPMHGFRDALDYYTKCSSIRFVNSITRPTLIISAANDPFLSKECFPTAQLAGHPQVTFETSKRGGHVGFTLFNKNGLYWSEMKALNFILP